MRLLQRVRALWGGALLLAPRRLLTRLGLSSRGVVALTRILGARHLLEVLILSHDRHRAPPRWPVIVDGLHATSMLAVARFNSKLRRDALMSAGAAALLAGWGEAERRPGALGRERRARRSPSRGFLRLGTGPSEAPGPEAIASRPTGLGTQRR